VREYLQIKGIPPPLLNIVISYLACNESTIHIEKEYKTQQQREQIQKAKEYKIQKAKKKRIASSNYYNAETPSTPSTSSSDGVKQQKDKP